MTHECVSVRSIESFHNALQRRFIEDDYVVQDSPRSEPMKRFALAFSHGDRDPVSTSSIPISPTADGMLLRKYNRDRAIDSAVRYPMETLQRFA